MRSQVRFLAGWAFRFYFWVKTYFRKSCFYCGFELLYFFRQTFFRPSAKTYACKACARRKIDIRFLCSFIMERFYSTNPLEKTKPTAKMRKDFLGIKPKASQRLLGKRFQMRSCQSAGFSLKTLSYFFFKDFSGLLLIYSNSSLPAGRQGLHVFAFGFKQPSGI